MSKFNELWESLVKNQTGLENGEYVASIKSSNLKHVLRQFYDIGYREGKEHKPSTDIINELFGGGL